MFVEKDLRKIPEIVADKNDKREEMRLGRRSAEFNGGIRVLCNLDNLPSFSNLTKLSLYDNHLKNIDVRKDIYLNYRYQFSFCIELFIF